MCLVYILTNVWVLGTPNACQNMIFCTVPTFLQYFDAKITKNEHIFALFPNSHWHKNAVLAPYKTSKNTYSDTENLCIIAAILYQPAFRNKL